jgi:nucleotide-binding universal stress UspA family protein/quercetin dioxygenase-like cupin family protein
MSAIHTILHPTDFSDNSRYAFQTACALARDYNAELILFHVVPPSAAPLLPEPTPDPLRPAEAQEFLKGRFNWPQPPDARVRAQHRVAEGDAPEEILRLARALPCDLIIMGTHGRTGRGRLLTGSVAEEVLRKAPCPVLAVRTPLPEPAPEAVPAKPGEVIDVRPLGAALAEARTQTLFRTDDVRIIRLVVPAGKEIAGHKAAGAVLVQGLEGRVAFTALGRTRDLKAGEMLYLPAGEAHAVRGIEGASLLLTVLPGVARPPQ